MRKRAVLAALASAAALIAQQPGAQHLGPDNGGFVLNTGWRVSPTGTQIPVDTFPMAARMTPDQKYLLVLNGGYHPPSISVIDIALGKEIGRAPAPDAWLGLTLSRSGDRVYVGGGSRAAVYEYTFSGRALKPSRVFPVVAEKDRGPEDFIGDVQFAPDGHLLYAADLFHDSVIVINPQSGLILSRIKTGRRPYRILFHPSGKSFYVSSWSEGSISQFDTATGDRIATIRVAPHTTDMVWSEGPVEGMPSMAARLFVSAGNTNSVYVLGASEAGDLSRLETINLALTPRQPLGMTPAGLSLSADGKKLFVACSGFNAAAVVDISGPRSRVAGMIPSGAYPTGIAGLPSGRIAILNGHGSGDSASGGTVQLADVPDDATMLTLTKEVIANSPYRDDKLDNAVNPAAVKHVLYIVMDGPAYDPAASPNLEKLSRDYVSLRPFFVNSGQSRAALNWAVAGIAPEFTERLAPSTAAGRRKTDDFEGQEPANSPPAGYLWTAVSQAGLSMRNYGFYVDNRATPEPDGTHITGVRDPILAPATDPDFRGPDPNYSDVDRAKEFVSDLSDYAKEGKLPQLLLMRLGNERASGVDLDQAIGRIVEAVSKTPFWSETAIFIVPATPDVPAWIVSPWVKPAAAGGAMSNQSSALRTIEILLGLRPLTIYEAGASPLFSVFAESPAPKPYALEPTASRSSH